MQRKQNGIAAKEALWLLFAVPISFLFGLTRYVFGFYLYKGFQTDPKQIDAMFRFLRDPINVVKTVIGNFEFNVPTAAAITALMMLAVFLIDRRLINRPYKMKIRRKG